MRDFELLLADFTYLREHYLTLEELKEHPPLNGTLVDRLRQLGCVPAASYRMRFDVRVYSKIFDTSTIAGEVELFPKAIVYWLASAQSLIREYGSDRIAELLESRFKEAFRTALLAYPGSRAGYPECFRDGATPNTRVFDATADEAWTNFMDGTYGVCLHHQTPINIVRKHVAVAALESLLGQIGQGQPVDRLEALTALETYDELGMPFAPHDHHLSSRDCFYQPVAEHLGLEGRKRR